MNSWRNVYAENLVLGGQEFPLLGMLRGIESVRAEQDYVWNGVHPRDLPGAAVIWLDGSTPGQHDVAGMVPDSVVEFRVLLLTSGRDTANRLVSGTNAQRVLPSGGDPGGAAPQPVAFDSYGSWTDFGSSAPRRGSDPLLTRVRRNEGTIDFPVWVTRSYMDDDYLTTPASWRVVRRSAGQAMTVTLGTEGARGSVSNPGTTLSRITVGGADVWRVARLGNVLGVDNSGSAGGPINGACLLIPVYEF